MSGQGKRFQSAGYTIPKPLILVDGKPMIEHVVSLFPQEEKIIFICNKEHINKTNMSSIITKISPTGIIRSIPYRGLGPVDAVSQAEDLIHDDEPVIVNYCDFFMRWDYGNFKKTMKKNKVDGAVICYKGFHPHLLGKDYYAGVKTNANNILLEIKEKYSYTPNKMDTWQSAGTYYFKNGRLLKYYFRMLIQKKMMVNNEYYVSLVYNLMQKDRCKTLVYPVDYFCQWGTPEDLHTYQYWSSYFKDKYKV